jgi:hypothetical protein
MGEMCQFNYEENSMLRSARNDERGQIFIT